MNWRILDIPEKPKNPESVDAAIRLNALGSLYFFSKYVLKRDRLSDTLHRRIARSLEQEHLHLVLEIPRDHLKALDLDTRIPTTAGTKPMSEIQPGDFVFGADGMPAKVLGVSPQYFSSKCWELEFSSGEKIICDEEHLWETDARRDRDCNSDKSDCPTVKTTRQILDSLKCRKENNHRVRVARAVQQQEIELLVPPYSLGAWLGDGTSSCGNLTCATDTKIIEEIRAEGEPILKTRHKYRWVFNGGKGSSSYRKRIASFAGRLRKLGLIKNKHIPEIYLRASARQRLSLLQGLMDTDGSISKEGQIFFQVTNQWLAGDVRRLVCSLGLKASPIGTWPAVLNGKITGTVYAFSFYSYPDVPIFRLKRKLDRQYAKRKTSRSYRQIVGARPVDARWVKCLRVDSPDNLYLCGEGYIPTHNTSLVTESLSMWWSLPFTSHDEEMMRTLGYDDAWIRWMKRAHNVNNRTLIVSENESNAIRFGHRIDSHYQSNAMFQRIFKEIIPGSTETWNDKTKTQRRTASGIGEGTFDFLGVGGAVQSRHYDRIIQDDIFGRDAKNSELVANDTIEYHRLLAGVLDHDTGATELGDEIVVGNRWSYYDLNGWIRENDKAKKWAFESHSAEGGCCEWHPAGVPIFFTKELIAEVKARFSVEDFAHQFLNAAMLPGECPFLPQWLRHYELYEGERNGIKAAFIRHNVYDGKTIGDISVSSLTRKILCDPNHSEQTGRANHALVVVGYDSETQRQYLLDRWAKPTGYDELVAMMYKLAKRWNLSTVYLEKIAAQQLLRYPIEYYGNKTGKKLQIELLNAPRNRGAKDERIRSLEPIFRNSLYWTRADQTDFENEYRMYPASRTIDLLDVMGYGVTLFDAVKYRDVVGAVESWNKRRKAAMATGDQ